MWHVIGDDTLGLLIEPNMRAFFFTGALSVYYLSTVLLCYMGLRKKSIGLDPHRFFFSAYSTTMLYETWELLFSIMLMFNEKHVDPI